MSKYPSNDLADCWKQANKLWQPNGFDYWFSMSMSDCWNTLPFSTVSSAARTQGLTAAAAWKWLKTESSWIDGNRGCEGFGALSRGAAEQVNNIYGVNWERILGAEVAYYPVSRADFNAGAIGAMHRGPVQRRAPVSPQLKGRAV